ncbi:MAG TPA: DUF3667 domain-containing protein [Steroidobacteraceae bacterium]|nr:DUF3667 domain-containing protein [Steroidobacteraceae bacterium]
MSTVAAEAPPAAAATAVQPPGAAAPAAVVPAAPAAAAPAARCDNCGAGVAGRYCGNCGQRLEPPVHSLWHFLAIAFEDVTHADSRLWRTLRALLFRPGFLTQEFLAGRRARYLPPVRLYLVLSVTFFLCASLMHPKAELVQIDTSDAGVPKAARVVPLADAASLATAPARPGETAAQRAARECGMINYDGPWHATLRPAAQQACLKIRADNARSLMAAFRHNLPRTMFLFLPLLAALMMLFYWRPRRYYVEHLLLLLHNHACVFVVLPAAWALSALVPRLSGWVDLAVFLYLVWYMYRSMRAVYGQGPWPTVAKLTALSFFYFVFGMLMFVLNFAYSALTLD